MTWVLYVDVAVGLALATGVLAASVLAGRAPAVHRALWVLGVALLVARALFSLAIGVATAFAEPGLYAFGIGALALALFVPSAVLRPRWAGIALLASAVLQPALLFILGRLAGLSEQEFPVEVMLGFYSLTVAVIGGILIGSTVGGGRERPAPGSSGDNAQPVSESAQRTASMGTESSVSGS